MQAGQRDEAEAKKAEVAGLKDKQSEFERLRDEADAAMRDLLAGLPNIPAAMTFRSVRTNGKQRSSPLGHASRIRF